MSATIPHPGKLSVNAFTPRMPETLEALGISENLMLDLVVRRLLLEGTSTLSNLAKKLRVASSRGSFGSAYSGALKPVCLSQPPWKS